MAWCQMIYTPHKVHRTLHNGHPNILSDILSLNFILWIFFFPETPSEQKIFSILDFTEALKNLVSNLLSLLVGFLNKGGEKKKILRQQASQLSSIYYIHIYVLLTNTLCIPSTS